ncbi:DUF1016 N-terminal domain-containing protein [Aeromonas caviae]
MRFFAEHCPKGQFGQQPADQLPWFHIVTLLTKLDDEAGREWYATQAVTNGWSRSTLGKVRTSIPRTKNENFSHLISMGYQ